MAKIKPVRVEDLQGGLVKDDATIIPDNALAEAINVFYNENKILQTRYGQTSFGTGIPDAVKVIHNCDSLAGNGTWAGTDDGVTAALDASIYKRGTGSITFDITVATSGNNDALLTNSTMTAVDVSTAKGGIGFWIYVPSGFTTNLTDVRLRVGSGAANYYEFTWQPSSFTSTSTWMFFYQAYSSATTTGTPVDTAINYLQLRVNYTGAYTDKVGVKVDDFASYSATFTKPVMSLKFFKANSSTAPRYLTANCGTSLFEYDETTTRWNVLKTGLTENTRFSMAAYKNIMYYCNGTDNYFSYTGATCTEHTGANTYKGKYIITANDIGYILGDPSVPSTLAYTGATPANLQTFTNALVLDEDDSSGKGTGLANLESVVIAWKNKKIYKVNVATPSRTQLDYSNGGIGGRAIVRVENEVFFQNDGGIHTLAQRQNLVGSFRAEALSDDIKQIFDEILKSSLEYTSAIYVPELKNCYFFVDTDENGVNETVLVYSVLVKKWTQYTGIAANEAVIWENSSGTRYLLYASATSGYVRQWEVGLDDNGNEINADVKTKAWNFNMPEQLKTVEGVDVFGFIAADSEIQFNIYVDDEDRSGDVFVDGNNYVTGIESGLTYGTSPLGGMPYGGGSGTGEEITYYPFKIRIPMYATGNKVQLRARNTVLDSSWMLTKVALYPYAQPIDVYENDYIA